MEEQFFDILAYLIILVAVFIAGKKIFYKSFKKEKSSCANGCNGCTAVCNLKDKIKVYQ